MTWYTWKCWRIARALTHEGDWDGFRDGDGRWRRIGRTAWCVLVNRRDKFIAASVRG